MTVNARQTLDDHVVQNAEFAFTYSLEEARGNAALDVEGSLSLDLDIINATGSAKHLNNKNSSTIIKQPIGGTAQVNFSEDVEYLVESLNVSYSDAIAENVSNLDDARRLLPLSILDITLSREIRHLDTFLVTKAAAALRLGAATRFKLTDLMGHDVFQTSFPEIKQQISNVQTAFAVAETEFTQAARHLLPGLRDGTIEYNAKTSELRLAVSVFDQRIRIAEQFIAKNDNEACGLQARVASLLADGLESHLTGLKPQSLTAPAAPRRGLSFGSAAINRVKHPLQSKLESPPTPPSLKSTARKSVQLGLRSETATKRWPCRARALPFAFVPGPIFSRKDGAFPRTTPNEAFTEV
ncbi:hypothetical protein B0T26DRAFT_755299 [Lasiosphaeria miniovina]|uniref:Uncharacterized protein n=1 Tax=Lasiosphaeria miniovina TaxID=1954250 RepID=A0AA40A6H0_9PEZI|nr:uncharacterized protein B0T26DRAFT_755299 [Lasiosphaeria miniovina]KAK0710201.1 hypothetical protein B0T26DRAFT_755299 [Lasiosphaeria miniovina]